MGGEIVIVIAWSDDIVMYYFPQAMIFFSKSNLRISKRIYICGVGKESAYIPTMIQFVTIAIHMCMCCMMAGKPGSMLPCMYKC